MKRKLVFATNNAHKLDEISAILGEKVELLSLKDIHCDIDIPETSDTLEGNAMLKAEYIYEHYGLDCFADDTGLEVEALNGEPGCLLCPLCRREKDIMRKPICRNYCRICKEYKIENAQVPHCYLFNNEWKEAFIRRHSKR